MPYIGHYVVERGAPGPGPAISTPEPSWKAEPMGRGSWSILLNCLLTLVLCVWTTIHIDFVPNRTQRQLLLLKVKYVVTAMLAPEVMMVVAGAEWINARRLRKDWCEAMKEHNGIEIVPGSDEDTFGMAGAFLVCMGSVHLCALNRLPNLPTIVNADGYRLLLKRDLSRMSTIDKNAASNKTKTDALGKAIVCSQGIWMIVQCITRKASGLPVTLLELHIAIHVFCALIMYLLWWDKPQDIGEPFVLFDDFADAGLYALASAGIVLQSSGSQETYPESKDNPKSSSELEMTVVPDEHSMGAGKEYPSSANGAPLLMVYIRPPQVPDRPQAQDHKIDLLKHPDFIFDRATSGSLIINQVLKVSGNGYNGSARIGIAELRVLSHIANRYGSNFPSAFHVASSTRESFTQQLSISFKNLLSSAPGAILAVAVILTYGACHVAAWGTHFPSLIEAWLWRVSSIIGAVVPSYFLVLPYFGGDSVLWNIFIHHPFTGCLQWIRNCARWRIPGARINEESYQQFISLNHLGRIGKGIDNLLYRVFIGMVISGRVFLLVESFISLRSLPEGSFKTTVWEEYWPHL